MTTCNDGATINRMGRFIHAPEGTYTLIGTTLTGPNGFWSMNVSSEAEAEAIVIGLHGGKRF